MSRARNLAGFGSAVTNPQNPVNVRLGIVTAIEYYGDGSNLTGTPGGLGTSLLPDDLTSPLNKIYYTDANLTIGSTITVDPPASASAAYTQYTNIVLQGDADLIVADGDDFIPDILGIGTDVDTPGILASGEGKVRVDNITDKSGVKAPKFPYGLAVPVGAAVSVGYGTEATPGLVGVDTSTGIFFPAAGSVAVSAGGTEALRVVTSGNVGLGTGNPATALEIGKGFIDPVIRLNDPADRRMSIRGPSANNLASVGTESANDLLFFTNGYSNERFRITSGGNINVSAGSTLQLGDNSITQNQVYRYEEIAGGAIKKYYVRDTLNSGQLTRFTFVGTDRTSAMITINATGSWTASNTATNHPAAQFMCRVFTNSSGTSSDSATVTTPFAYTYSAASHYAFNNSGGNGYSIDITNPTGDDGVSFFYEVIVQSAVPGSQHAMTASSTA
ncbi:hypothetical protein [Synechococcus phage S-B05]|nr:hypothetical protein [Synechococcus phage S-B05]